MRKFVWVLGILWSVWLAACQGQGRAAAPHLATPTAMPAPVVVALPPALEPATKALRLCAQTVAVPLAVFTVPQPAPLPPTANLRLWWGNTPPEGMQAFPLAKERLVAIVARGNGAMLDETTLRRMVIGQVRVWGGKAVVALWLPVPGTAEGERLDAWLGDAPRRGDAVFAPSPAAMLEAVGSDAAALGFVPSAWLQAHAASVRQVTLERPPAAWEAPILALLPPDAPPAAQKVVGCLQQGPGRQALARLFSP